MNILIIGCKGFIGSHCQTGLSVGNEVWGADVINDYVTPRYLQVDATNSDFKEVFSKQQFDVCINCSGAASVPASFQSPAKDFQLNVANVLKILDAIRQIQPGCRFINLSSAAVYGNPDKLPVMETASKVPVSPYGLHKKFSEEIVKEYADFYALGTCSIRLFSVYGPGLCKQLFWDVHTKIMQDNNITLWGTGNETRDFLFIDDVVRAIEIIIQKTIFNGEAINVGSGVETSIREVMELFQNLHFKKFTYTFGGQVRKGDPANWQADINTLKQMGFLPDIGLKEGLASYIGWAEKEGK